LLSKFNVFRSYFDVVNLLSKLRVFRACQYVVLYYLYSEIYDSSDLLQFLILFE
jgi:hypothetical protein